MADPSPITREGAKADAHRVLQGAQYKHDRPSLLQRIVTRAVGDIERALSHASSAVGGPVALIAIVTLIVVGIVLLRVKLGAVPIAALFGSRSDAKTRLTAADYRTEAAAFAASGEFAEAVRASTRAMVRELEERGVLEPVPGSTTAALSSRAARAVPAVGPDAARIARVFDEIWYSGRPATVTDAATAANAESRISKQRLRVSETLDLPDFGGLAAIDERPVPADV